MDVSYYRWTRSGKTVWIPVRVEDQTERFGRPMVRVTPVNGLGSFYAESRKVVSPEDLPR